MRNKPLLLAHFLSLPPYQVLAGILALYLLLLFPTISRQGISWDEQNDLWVAQSYLQPGGWLTGSPIDPSQTRLPMAFSAIFMALLSGSDLLISRAASVLVGGLTIFGVYTYARLHFTVRDALLASFLLAINPFFLAFARVAFTETDIYLACAFIWLLVAFHRWQVQPTWGHAALIGLLFGVCLSTKFTALAILPAVCIGFFLSARKTRIENSPDTLSALVLFVLVSALAFFILPPEHYTNPAILESILWRGQYELKFNLSFRKEAASLHALCLLLKPSPLLGASLLIGAVFAFIKQKTTGHRLPLMITLFYTGGLLILPIAQTFYTVPLLPILSLFSANLLLFLVQKSRRVGIGLLIIIMAGWLLDMVISYPDYHLNGYQYLGDRIIAGRSSIGYRSVVQTPSDGTQQIFEWLNEHARPGERVLAAVIDWHIVESSVNRSDYIIESAFDRPVSSRPDYFVEQINALIWQGWGLDTPRFIWRRPYNLTYLKENYQKVFSVQRRFGIEMASVWKRVEP